MSRWHGPAARSPGTAVERLDLPGTAASGAAPPNSPLPRPGGSAGTGGSAGPGGSAGSGGSARAAEPPYSFELGWSFPQWAALFLCAAVLVGVVARLGEQKTSSTIAQGAGDFVSPAVVIMLARGVTVIMNNSRIMDTVLHSIEGVVKGTSSGVFAVIVFGVNLPLAFLIPSTSGHAILAMPILAPLADFAGVSRAVVVTA